jgi:hypothetical protein
MVVISIKREMEMLGDREGRRRRRSEEGGGEIESCGVLRYLVVS